MDTICQLGIHTAQENIRDIEKQLKNPNRVLISTEVEKKAQLLIDLVAEENCRTTIQNYNKGKFGKWHFHGEESLLNKNLDLSKENSICVLADVIDGTDLLERGLGNWCSCFIFFDPRAKSGERLLASFVALPDKEVYFARHDMPGAFITTKDGQITEVAGRSAVEKVCDASICFYGQKHPNLVKTVSLLNNLTDQNLGKLRIYNLAGIPMMMKLIDHRIKKARSIDAVFDVNGQKPHDVVPGAYILKKAGATIKNLQGDDINYCDFEELLLKPSSTKLKYVAAATPELAKNLLAILVETGQTSSACKTSPS